MIKLSIIIPVYNVEKYVGRCIESCLKQDLALSTYEILVVNDGSQDGSMEVVRQFACQYNNIRIVEQENAGLSAARNIGLKNAKGEYVWFIDSDDYVESDVLGNLINDCYSQELDVLCFGLQLSYDNGNKEQYAIIDNSKGVVLRGESFVALVGMPPAAWCAIYRKKFLFDNRIHFLEGVIHEDQEFTPRVYYLAQRIKYSSIIAYNYYQRRGSIMTSPKKRAKKSKDLLVICDSLYHFTKQHIVEGTPAYNTMIGKINFAFSQSLRNYTRGVSTIAEYKAKPYYPLDLRVEGERRNRWKYWLINFSIPLYLFVYRMIKR